MWHATTPFLPPTKQETRTLPLSLSLHPSPSLHLSLLPNIPKERKAFGLQRADSAKYKIVYVHGIGSCRHDTNAKFISPEVVEELGVYVVSFDRPGYGESEPDPKRLVKSLALDIEELADQLGLGPNFYVVGFSMGGQVLWSTLKCIPHRLAGVALLAPVVNYW